MNIATLWSLDFFSLFKYLFLKPETRNALILITIAEGNPTEIQNNPEVIKAYLGVDANYAYVLETGKVALQGTGEELLQDEGVKKAYLGE